MEHPCRNNITAEQLAVVLYKRENGNITKIIQERYSKEHFPDNNGLIEGCLIIRKHNEPDCIKVMNLWFNEIKNYSYRDQLSFNLKSYQIIKNISSISY